MSLAASLDDADCLCIIGEFPANDAISVDFILYVVQVQTKHASDDAKPDVSLENFGPMTQHHLTQIQFINTGYKPL